MIRLMLTSAIVLMTLSGCKDMVKIEAAPQIPAEAVKVEVQPEAFKMEAPSIVIPPEAVKLVVEEGAFKIEKGAVEVSPEVSDNLSSSFSKGYITVILAIASLVILIGVAWIFPSPLNRGKKRHDAVSPSK